MNNGKICVSVCAETADEMIESIKRAEEFADVLEVRFDCLNRSELNCEEPEKAGRVLKKIFEHHDSVPWISTFRTKEQGGYRELSELERENFWNSGFETEHGDFEEDKIEDSLNWLWFDSICSYHDFSGTSENIGEIYQRLKATSADIVKIAVRADDITDAIPIWKLIERAKSDGKGIIPIAMGEAGKWTRILGLAHGAFLTYASLDTAGETAPGQVTAKELSDLYRVKELDLETTVYGIIGDPISHSLSPAMHNPAYVKLGINAVFIPFLVKDVDEFIRRMVRPETREVELNFGGFAVTMPHKESIMKHLDAVDPVAEKIGAVNTVKIEGGKLIGYNTDAHGFITPLKKHFGDLRDANVAVFGGGGAARACVNALTQEGANVEVFVRDLAKAELFSSEFVSVGLISNFKSEISNTTPENQKPKAILSEFEIIVDTTPLGMSGPLVDESLFTADELMGVKFVYDLVTKPFDTPIILEAKKAGIPAIGGIEMLVEQGARQFEILTGQTAPVDVMREAVFAKIN